MICLPEIKTAEVSTYGNFAKCHQALFRVPREGLGTRLYCSSLIPRSSHPSKQHADAEVRRSSYEASIGAHILDVTTATPLLLLFHSSFSSSIPPPPPPPPLLLLLAVGEWDTSCQPQWWPSSI